MLRRWLGISVVALMAATAALPVLAADLPPGGTFTDDDGLVHEGYIEAIAELGIARGCNPPDNTLFCPDDFVSRAQMAAFLVRARGYTDVGPGDLFTDDDGSVFETDIDKLGTAAVTRGCNPPDNTLFCPDDPVTRAQMAAFLVRAFGFDAGGGADLFTDDDASEFETDIDKLGTAEVTLGCNPPDNTLFCPDEFVTRGQMASFIGRALGLTPIIPPPTTSTTDPGSSTTSSADATTTSSSTSSTSSSSTSSTSSSTTSSTIDD